MSDTLTELLHYVRVGGFNSSRSPPVLPAFAKSPGLHSPSLPTPTTNNTSPTSATPFTSMHAHSSSLPPPRQHRNSLPSTGLRPGSSNNSMTTDEGHPAHLAPMFNSFSQGGQNYNHQHTLAQGPILPPFSSIQTMAEPMSQSNVPIRYQSGDQNYPRNYPASTTAKRQAASTIPIIESSDEDDDDNGELPASGLVAPWEVLRGLADVAVERATKVRCFFALWM